MATEWRGPQAGRIRPALVAGFFVAQKVFLLLRLQTEAGAPPGGETIQSDVVDRIEVL